MIRVFTGWSHLGGSTVAFINLVNMFNGRGYDAMLYGPHDWADGKCRFQSIEQTELNKIASETVRAGDVVFVHFLPLSFNNAGRGFLKKTVYSCHEKDILPINKVAYRKFDFIHYVSSHQRDWHNIVYPNVVIPNVVSDLMPIKRQILPECKKVGGVIGSIDPNKKTHKAIQAALDDGCDKVLLFGLVTDQGYYQLRVEPLLQDERVEYAGYENDRSIMYGCLDTVYHASASETYNFIEHECRQAETEFKNVGKANPESIYMEEEDIFNTWKDVLCLDE